MPIHCQVRSSSLPSLAVCAIAALLVLAGAPGARADTVRMVRSPTIQAPAMGYYAISKPLYGNTGTGSSGTYVRYRWEVAAPGSSTWRGALGGYPDGFFITSPDPNKAVISSDVPANLAVYKARLAAYAQRPARRGQPAATSATKYSNTVTIMDIPQLSVRRLPSSQQWPQAIVGTSVLPRTDYTIAGVNDWSEPARSYREAWRQTNLPIPVSSADIRDGWARLSLIVASMLVAQMSPRDPGSIKAAYGYFKDIARPTTESTLVSNYVRFECARRVTLQILQWLVDKKWMVAAGDWMLSATGGTLAGNAVTAAGRRTWENMLTYLGKETAFKNWLAQSAVNKAINLAVNPSAPLQEILARGANDTVAGTLKTAFPAAMLRCQMLSTPASEWAKPRPSIVAPLGRR